VELIAALRDVGCKLWGGLPGGAAVVCDQQLAARLEEGEKLLKQGGLVLQKVEEVREGEGFANERGGWTVLVDGETTWCKLRSCMCTHAWAMRLVLQAVGWMGCKALRHTG
jgi:hypothetical protein